LRVSITFFGDRPLAEMLPVVQAAEAAGLHGVWSAEHVGLNDAMVPSALFLANTERIAVGLIGVNATSRHPGLLAMEMATLCELGGDRVRLQVGVGDPQLAARIGGNTGSALGTVRGLVSSLRAALSGERVVHESAAFRLDGFRLRPRGPVPPIDVLAIRPRMLELAAGVADGVSLSVGASHAYLTEAVVRVEQALERLGRDRSTYRITALSILSVASTLGEARRGVARTLAASPPETARVLAPDLPLPEPEDVRRALAAGGPDAVVDLLSDEAIDGRAAVATPETLPQVLDGYAATGIDELGLLLRAAPANQLELVRSLGTWIATPVPASKEGTSHVS
jgi:5,10-methylenetetrahydromethanopterin reductase